jgi:hypothetical protein
MLRICRPHLRRRRYSIPWHGREVRIVVTKAPPDLTGLQADLKGIGQVGPSIGALSRELIAIAQVHGMIVEFAPDVRRGVLLNREVVGAQMLPSPWAS